MTLLHQDPFESLTWWTPTTPANWTIVAGRNGNGVQVAAATESAVFLFPTESADATIGVAFQVSSIATARPVFSLRSDAGVTSHVSVRVNANGSLNVVRGAYSGTIIGATSATGLIAINTWYYLELQATLSDTVGKIELRLNGSTIIGPTTGLDTKNGGTKTVFDSMALVNVTGAIQKYDDAYIKVGAGETFLGSIAVATSEVLARQSTRVAIVSVGAAQNFRQSLRAAIRTFGLFNIQTYRNATKVLTRQTPTTATVRSFRQSVKVLTSLAPLPNEARLARISTRLLTTGPSEARLAQIGVRVLTSMAAVAGATVKVWSGSAFVDAPVKVWNGSAFVDAVAVKTWNGSAFV